MTEEMGLILGLSLGVLIIVGLVVYFINNAKREAQEYAELKQRRITTVNKWIVINQDVILTTLRSHEDKIDHTSATNFSKYPIAEKNSMKAIIKEHSGLSLPSDEELLEAIWEEVPVFASENGIGPSPEDRQQAFLAEAEAVQKARREADMQREYGTLNQSKACRFCGVIGQVYVKKGVKKEIETAKSTVGKIISEAKETRKDVLVHRCKSCQQSWDETL